jgi:hypothetical protein
VAHFINLSVTTAKLQASDLKNMTFIIAQKKSIGHLDKECDNKIFLTDRPFP